VPSHLHEILIEMFRDRPALAAELLGGPLHITLPEFDTARLSSADLTDVAPTEYRADAVVTLNDKGSVVLAVVIEVQLRIDPRKRRSWPAYVSTLHARLGCPVALLVMCPEQPVADWCAAPVTIGPPGSMLTPVALGPAQVPVLDLDTARRSPELAVLSALAHGTGPEPARVFEALLAALNIVDLDHADLYTDLIFSRLPLAARDYLEELMTTTGHRYQSEFARRYFDQGEAQGEARGLAQGEARGLAQGEARGEARGLAKGEARAVLAILDARGIEVSDDARARITACTDHDRLGIWIRLAATADKMEDLNL
jgi:hypothetical protein